MDTKHSPIWNPRKICRTKEQKKDLDNISSDWEDLEKKTLSTLKETMEYFTQFTENE